MFNKSDIFKAAWKSYRLARMGVFLPSDAVTTRRAFLPPMFAKCLRAAWAEARKRAGWVSQIVATPVATGKSVEAIRSELSIMERGSDFINWTAHRALSAELSRIEA